MKPDNGDWEDVVETLLQRIEELEGEILLLEAKLIHANSHDCMAHTAGDWGEEYTWDSLSDEMKNHWIQQVEEQGDETRA